MIGILFGAVVLVLGVPAAVLYFSPDAYRLARRWCNQLMAALADFALVPKCKLLIAYVQMIGFVLNTYG